MSSQRAQVTFHWAVNAKQANSNPFCFKGRQVARPLLYAQARLSIARTKISYTGSYTARQFAFVLCIQHVKFGLGRILFRLVFVCLSVCVNFRYGAVQGLMMNETQSFFSLIGRLGIAAFFIIVGAMKLIEPSQLLLVQNAINDTLSPSGLVLDDVSLLVLAYFIAGAEIVGGLFILTGYMGRFAASFLCLFTLIAAVFYHLPSATELGLSVAADQGQLSELMKNFCIAGGLIYLSVTGPGIFSIERRIPFADP